MYSKTRWSDLSVVSAMLIEQFDPDSNKNLDLADLVLFDIVLDLTERKWTVGPASRYAFN